MPMEIQTELSMEECSINNNVFENIFQPEQWSLLPLRKFFMITHFREAYNIHHYVVQFFLEIR